MRYFPSCYRPAALLVSVVGLVLAGCETAYIPEFFGGGGQRSSELGAFTGGSEPFTANLIQARTFTHGTSVCTVTYLLDHPNGGDPVHSAEVLLRRPYAVDFNRDGRIDPVVGYGEDQAVIQILLSNPGAALGVVDYISLTLDSKRDMQNLADVAVGDIDCDGGLDIIAAAEFAVWYFHHPSGQPTTTMYLWGNPDPFDDLHERIDASYTVMSDEEIQAMIDQAVGPGVNIADYIVTSEQLYTNVEVGDLDNDGDHDICASRSFVVDLTPRPQVPVEAIQIVDGDVIALINPGYASTGHGWSMISIGSHERQVRLDRDGARGLLLYDLDGDGDLDVLSAAGTDNNVQVAWFENPVANRPGVPGALLDPGTPWLQWRIGSVRDAWGLAIADLTGDARPDVVATGGGQQQVLLFVQPDSGPARAWDWDTHVLATLEFEPRDLKVFDLDFDGVYEIVLGGATGELRYFEARGDPRLEWSMQRICDYAGAPEAGWLGYGDLDGDSDPDLAVVLCADDENDSRITWVRNETVHVLP